MFLQIETQVEYIPIIEEEGKCSTKSRMEFFETMNKVKNLVFSKKTYENKVKIALLHKKRLCEVYKKGTRHCLREA